MHIAIFTDMEGSFGIWRMRQCRTGTPEWQYGRECLTQDVNNVIHGAFDGGADTVTVRDTHNTGFNCIRKKLDPRVSYIGGHHISPKFFGEVAHYDLILFVAIHAASGTQGSFFPHTHYGIFSEIRINSRPVSEMELYGSYLGEFGVPIGFFSGEGIAVEQALKGLPWAKSVIVDKRKETYFSGEQTKKYLKNGREKLRYKSSHAVSEHSSMKPLVLKGPLLFEVTFNNISLAQKYNTWNFPQSDITVRWESGNMIEGFDNLNKLAFIPRKLRFFKKPVYFLIKKYSNIRSNYFAPRSNSEGAVNL